MTYRHFSFISTTLLGVSLVAQAPKQPAKAAPVTIPVAAVETPSQEDVIKIKITPYRPALIRDPFSAPTDMEQASKGDLVDDIGVKGYLRAGGVVYAVVSDSRGITKRLPIGYRFRDGELVSVDEKSVTFHQWDISSTNRSVFRTVVKTFKREEGKR